MTYVNFTCMKSPKHALMISYTSIYKRFTNKNFIFINYVLTVLYIDISNRRMSWIYMLLNIINIYHQYIYALHVFRKHLSKSTPTFLYFDLYIDSLWRLDVAQRLHLTISRVHLALDIITSSCVIQITV